MSDSIWIVTNCAGDRPNEKNAWCGRELVKQRIKDSADILSEKRFNAAQKLKVEDRIVMHQGGAASKFRKQFGSGQIVAAGRIKEVAQLLTEADKQHYSELWKLTEECYTRKQLEGNLGIIFYEFPKGMSGQPLPKEDVPYRPMPGDNFIEIKPNDHRYPILDAWWNENRG